MSKIVINHELDDERAQCFICGKQDHNRMVFVQGKRNAMRICQDCATLILKEIENKIAKNWGQ